MPQSTRFPGGPAPAILATLLLGYSILPVHAQTTPVAPKNPKVKTVLKASALAGATLPPASLGDGTYVGEVRMFATEQVPAAGWRICNGDSLIITNHKALFDTIGNRFGSDNAGRFKLPDLRGSFLRGWNAGKTPADGQLYDPDAPKRTVPGGGPDYGGINDHVGTWQEDRLQIHQHNDAGHSHTLPSWSYQNDFACGSACGALTGGPSATINTGYASITDPTNARAGVETRPYNVSVLFAIRDPDWNKP